MLLGCRNPNIVPNMAVYILYILLLVAYIEAAIEIKELINNPLYYSFAIIVQYSGSWIKVVRA